jgi:short-subunit dehydrogenase
MQYNGFTHWWRAMTRRRPWWMNLLMYFCMYMAFIHIPIDFLFTPLARDEQVWFGIVWRGLAAKIGELAHWAVFAAGAFGFWHMRTWMWPWAAVYAAQVTFSMVVWFLFYRGGLGGFVATLISLAFFGGITALLWRARPLFHAGRPSLRARYGEWALITGASAGIGTEFARALARDGMSCVLTARRADRLESLAKELESAYAVKTRVIPVDLSAPGGAEQLVERVADLDVALVVANAGYGMAGRFDAHDAGRLQEMVHLNCVAPVVMISRLLPRLQDRGRGGIVVVSSTAGHQPVPFNAVYGATKAFDLVFGEALWAELQGSGIDVLVVQPGPTVTEFQAVAGETPHQGEPASQVVGVALNALGRQPSVISGWFNWLRANAAVRLVPRSLVALIAGRVMAQWVPGNTR